MVANKVKVAYPVLLVLAGLGISFVPGIPVLKIEPELIFIIFLPPLLYEAAWSNSWKELWHWRRIITSFAFVVVFFTATSVALVANYFIPGFSLALGFLLGGIVSPPDAVSASAILRFVKVPKRMSSILEGESLLNDASSLIIFRFALIAIGTGQFVWHEAVLSFIWMVLGGIALGVLVGFIFLKAHKWLPTDVNMDIVFTLVTPYAMYIAAEELHASGVLAVVSGGLFLSYHRHKFLTGSSRLRSENVWHSLVFLLNGLVFMLIGLDLPEITQGLKESGISIYGATGYAVLVTALLIISRMVAAFGAVVITKIASYFITVADPNPGLKAPLILGWTGMRGVVSLAAALSIPATLEGGEPFPYRNLILYITFVVILLTLVVQGLTLPIIINKIRMPQFDDHLPEEETKELIRTKLAKAALECMEGKYKTEHQRHLILQQFSQKWGLYLEPGENHDIPDEVKEIYMNVLEKQRQVLLDLNNHKQRVDEEIVRRFLHQLDLEEEKIKA